MIGMRACGIPAPRALAPVLLICAVFAPLTFFYNDLVLPRTNAYYTRMQVVICCDPSGKFRAAGVWYRVGNSVYEAGDLDSRAGTASNLKVYELGEDFLPTSRVDAREARHIGGGVWRLTDPVRVSLTDGTIREVAAGPFAKLGEGLEARVNTRHMSLATLRREIEEVEAGGMDATHFRVDYYVKWAAPLGCLVLPALALFFAVGGPPFPSASVTGIVSVAAAVSFILTTGVSTSLGYGGALAPVVAGWGPPALFGLIAAYLGFRLRNLGRR
jgi:lipopolysaccharide export system permease protein